MWQTSKKKQKQLGIYYTPYELSSVLSKWSVTQQNDKILEPSFGGCGFLLSCLDRLNEMGVLDAKSQLYGVDIDPDAFEFLKRKVKIDKYSNNFLQKSFLDVSEKEFGTKFSVIIGNPPYVSQQNMNLELRESCQKLSKSYGLKNIKRASLWVYFILKSLEFLEKSGNIAFVLPISAVHTGYSEKVFSLIASKFEKLELIKIRNRIFTSQGTSEMAVVFLARNFKANNPNKEVVISEVDDVEELAEFLSISTNEKNKQFEFSPYSLKDEINYKTLSNCLEVKKVSDFFYVRIGFVTGLKKYFILNKEKQKNNQLPDGAVRPVLSNASLSKGVNYTTEDHHKNVEENAECLVFNPKKNTKSKKIKRYLEKIGSDKLDSIKTFQNRKYWYRPDDENAPDAFMMYLCQSGHKIIVNSAKVNSTNNVHRLYLKTELPRYRIRLIAISMLSSFSQLSCELQGREYGSGVLKLEPSLAKSVQLLIPTAPCNVVNECFYQMNELLKKSDLVAATFLADSFLVKHSRLDGIENKLKSCRIILLNKLYKRLNTRKSYCIVNNITSLFSNSSS